MSDTANPTATTDAHPVLLVSRQVTAEAVLVTADNHGFVAEWVRSKGDGWFTHAKNWGEPGLGYTNNPSDPTNGGSVNDGQLLAWDNSQHRFFTGQPEVVLQRWALASEPEADRSTTRAKVLREVATEAAVMFPGNIWLVDWLNRLAGEAEVSQ